MKVQNQHGLINHVVLLVDSSGSMNSIGSSRVREVFEAVVKRLENISRTFDQEVRVSVYFFNDNVTCARFDTDVYRVRNIFDQYRIGGSTVLLDAFEKAVGDLEKTAQMYGDHSFLLYVLTDGEENGSRTATASSVATRIKRLDDRWTTCIQVPTQQGRMYAERYGFPRENVEIWNTANVEEAANRFERGMQNYVTSRAAGIRGTKSFFNLDVSNLNTVAVQDSLDKISARSVKLCQNTDPKQAVEIRPLIEKATGRDYVLGHAYYQLVKKETI